MGPISERHKEGVGGSDAGVNRMRRMLIDTARALENGIEPPHPSEEFSKKNIVGEGVIRGKSWASLLEQETKFYAVAYDGGN